MYYSSGANRAAVGTEGSCGGSSSKRPPPTETLLRNLLTPGALPSKLRRVIIGLCGRSM